jgi:hypothetical protein
VFSAGLGSDDLAGENCYRITIMSGLVALIDPGSTQQAREQDFSRLLELTCQFKQLIQPEVWVNGMSCTAAKIDAPSSLHHGAARNAQTGSWLLAVGTLVALEGENDPQPVLSNLLADLERNGPAALQRWDGHFGAVFYNGREHSLYVISDPMGDFAVYYGRRARQIFISTSALAVARMTSSRPDALMIECFLRTGHPHGEKTLWEDVKRVRPATILKFTDDRLEEAEYWAPVLDESIARLSLNNALERAEEIISRVFKRVLSREGLIWADLTGGFDTRLNAICMAKNGIPFVSYCVGPADHPDVLVSQKICAVAGWEYRHMPLPEDWAAEQCGWFETALHKGDAHLNIFQLASVLRGQRERSAFSTAHVSGTGADEWRYHVYGAKILFHSPNLQVNYDEILDSRILGRIPLTALGQDRTAEVRSELREHLARLETGYAGYDVLPRTDIIFLRHRHPIHGGAYLSSEAGLVRAIMPFCFKELENFGFSLKNAWRIRYHCSFVRNLLERGDPDLAAISTAKGEPAFPIRLDNAARFGPLWQSLINIAAQKVTRKLFKKSMPIFPPHRHSDYPLPAWRRAGLNWAIEQGLVEPSRMHSAALYQSSELQALFSQAIAGDLQHAEFLERVVTVEMALRSVNASIG